MSISWACNSWPQCIPRPRGRQPLPTPTAGPQCAAQGVRRENGASHGHGLFGMRSGTHENPPGRLTARGTRAREPMCRWAGLVHLYDGLRLLARKVVSREKQAPGDHAVCSLVSSAPRSLSGASHCASATSGRVFSALRARCPPGACWGLVRAGGATQKRRIPRARALRDAIGHA